MEVFDRIQLHLWSRSLTFRLAVVFQVLPDRIVQRTVEQILVLKIVSLDRIQLRTWGRSLLGEVFQVFSQVRVPQRPHRVCMMSLMLEFKGFFALFPGLKKSAGQSPHPGSELGADFTSTLSAHQMPPEQLVDVPVPQVHERSSRSLVYDLESLHRWWEAQGAARPALLEEEQMDEDEEEEEVEVSRFLPHFRPRRWCWYVRAGSICPRGWDCTFAHHESELHPDSW